MRRGRGCVWGGIGGMRGVRVRVCLSLGGCTGVLVLEGVQTETCGAEIWTCGGGGSCGEGGGIADWRVLTSCMQDCNSQQRATDGDMDKKHCKAVRAVIH